MSEENNVYFNCSNIPDCLLASNTSEYRVSRELFNGYTLFQISSWKYVCFLHSVIPSSEHSAAILVELLDTVISSGLITQLDKLFVIHYGVPLAVELVESYRGRYSNIHFHYYSSDIARFEIPTLQILHYYSKLNQYAKAHVHSSSDSRDRLAAERSDSYVLYLHTKGVSVVRDSASTRDWRQYMTYFSVELHRQCLKLFRMHAEYDAMGVNLLKARNNTDREQWHFSGNYWWARTRYTASLPRLSIFRNGKYDAELWIGSGPVPVYLVSLYSSYKNHYIDPIPRDTYIDNWLTSADF